MGQQINFYIDGSYNDRAKTAGWGVIMVTNDKVVAEWCGGLPTDPKNNSRNVVGEVESAKQAIAFAIEKGLKRFTIFYDYVGLEMWATNKWKCNKPVSQEYRAYVFEAEQTHGLDISWKHVKGHSQDFYNDRADFMAKMGCGNA